MSTETVVTRMAPAGARFGKPIEDACIEFGISTEKDKAHHIGQLAHETGDFRTLTENLNYSAQGMADTWPDRYAVNPRAREKQPNELALRLHRRPNAIANNVYANRLGNGPEASGDGWKFRGRGLIQLTGRDNYRRCSLALFGDERLLDNPDLLLEPATAARAAAWYWADKGLSPWANMDDVLAVSRGVNLGNPRSTRQPNGLEDRAAKTRRAAGLFRELRA